MTDKQLINDLLKAGEEYLVKLVQLATNWRVDDVTLAQSRSRFIDAVEAVVKAADQ